MFNMCFHVLREKSCAALVEYTYLMIPPLYILDKNHCHSETLLFICASCPQLRVIEADEKGSRAPGSKLACTAYEF